MSRFWLGARLPSKLLVAVGVLFGGRSALAQPQSAGAPEDVSLAPIGCDDLDVSETERLLRVELAVVAARAERPRAPSVSIACTHATLHIEISDPLTQAKRALDVPAPPRAPGRERTVALAASQLFLSSWLEMIVQTRPPPPEPKREQRAVEPVSSAAPPLRLHYELAFGGLMRLRNVSKAFATLGPELHFGVVTPAHWLLGVHALGEFGSASRSMGTIQLSTFGAGAEGGHRWGSERWAFDAELGLSWSLIHARGKPNAESVQGASAQGSALDVALSAGPVLIVEPFVLKAVAEFGATAPGVLLRVANDAPVRDSGVWLGAALLVGLRLGS
jgi:hypothetical protein